MTESEAERIVSQIERERFRYWRRSPAVYVREWLPDGTWFEGFVVHAKNGKKAMEIDRLIRSKARKIVSKKVRKKMSQRKKAKAIAVGTASALSYKRFGKDVEGSTARNLKKNKGYCMIYALVYQAACDRAGLKCKVAFGTANGEEHAWNQVSIGGKRRYVDACWYDASNGSGRYVLSSGLWRTHKLNELGTFYEYK